MPPRMSKKEFLKRAWRSPHPGRAAVLVLSGLFLWAGVAKLNHREDFFNSVAHYELLSRNLAYQVSLWIPRVEIAVALLLLTPVRFVRAAGLAAYFGMLVVFTGGLISLWVRGKHVNCGCFGGLGESHPAWSVLRNVGLLALVLLAASRLRRRREAPERSAEESVAG